MYDCIVIGGGLAGLISSIELARQDFRVLVVEKYQYPFHKVCGEYISNEVRPYLENLGLNLTSLDAKDISKLQISSPAGKFFETKLPLGGFGVSRYVLDYQLFTLAKSFGVEFMLNTLVENVEQIKDTFFVDIHNGQSLETKIVISAYGKRTMLDKQMNRRFLLKSSPFLAVKYHIKFDFPKDTIALHNFKNGYCGISAIEADKYCLCYLTERSNFKNRAGIQQVEEEVLCKNPFLKKIFNEAEFLFSKPEVINEISFEPKSIIEKGTFMVGDSAGLITPLCGNGMSMAIRGGKILSELIIKHLRDEFSREILEKKYLRIWTNEFSSRLAAGRKIQNMFGDEKITEIAVGVIKNLTFLHKPIIRLTHGKTMKI